jgi:hypothetical protein
MEQFTTRLHFKDAEGTLRTVASGDMDFDLEVVNDPKVKEQIVDLGLTQPKSPVLCCITNNDKQVA